jgi:hypothetical protein
MPGFNLFSGLNTKKFMDANSPVNDAELYRKALEKAVYGGVGQAYGQGLQGLQGYLSTAGPLADSGTRAALGARLASNLYGQAAGQVGQGYASYLGESLRARREQQYRLALMKAQAKANKKNFLASAAGGVAGFLSGGPLGAAVGYKFGGGGGGGGYFGNDFGGGRDFFSNDYGGRTGNA